MRESNIEVSEEGIGILVKLGLTPTQAKVYLSLVTLGKSRAKTLTKFSTLSRQDTYQTLSELFEIGLIEKEVTKPMEYQAISPKICLELLMQRRNKTTNEMQQTAKIFFGGFKKRPEPLSRENSQILLIPEKEPVLFNAQTLVNHAQETICVITPSQKLSAWIQDESNSFLNAMKRNVKLQFLTDLPKNTNSWKKILIPYENNSQFNVKYIPNLPLASFGIYDGKKILLELSATGNYLGSQVIITENISIIEIASSHFELMWSRAKSKKLRSRPQNQHRPQKI